MIHPRWIDVPRKWSLRAVAHVTLDSITATPPPCSRSSALINNGYLLGHGDLIHNKLN
ncbi:hypothetical protein M378DRAFT_154639 [Amanita muscaria Koide BX008]|uniref:Uncharacterized protein n=1 Tax=Amanita muscaria (strain Koide BX008) TaxID=946122 RepID=A0A0C2XPP3_AMAMK|nr:hypothetical protein M378DRAFT_154639 [Amanita muscaria Koide BX008]